MKCCKHCGSKSIEMVKITAYTMAEDAQGIAQVKFTRLHDVCSMCTKCTSTTSIDEK